MSECTRRSGTKKIYGVAAAHDLMPEDSTCQAKTDVPVVTGFRFEKKLVELHGIFINVSLEQSSRHFVRQMKPAAI